MSEFETRSGRVLHLQRLDRRETKRQVDRFVKAGKRQRTMADKLRLAVAWDRLFAYCARGVLDDPPADAFSELPECLQPGDGDPNRARVAWLELVVLGSEHEAILLAAAVCGLALGYTVEGVRRLQKNLGRWKK